MEQIRDAKGSVRRYAIDLTVNGDPRTVVVKANTLLVNVLRDQLGLTGTKRGCELGDCGSCTVLLDGEPVDSCLVLALEADGCERRHRGRGGAKQPTGRGAAGVLRSTPPYSAASAFPAWSFRPRPF